MVDNNKIKIMAQPQMDPHVCKFVLDRDVYPQQSFNCISKEQAKGSPLLEALFELEGVAQVMVSQNTISVAKTSLETWPVLGKQIGVAIREAVQSGKELMSPDLKGKDISADKSVPAGEEAQVIKRLLDSQINPAVAMHGGHVSLVDVKDNIVYVKLSGGCQGCGMASVTLKQGIEVAIKEAVPSIREVYDVTDHASGQNPYYQPTMK